MVLLPSISIGAATPVKKVASISTYRGEGEARTLSQVEQYFYNSFDSIAFDFTYKVNGSTKTLSSYKYQFYDEQRRHVADSASYKKTYYTYDDAGHVVKAVNWSNYNNPNYPDTKQDSTLYFYTGDRLDSLKKSDYSRTKYIYFYNKTGQLEHFDQYGTNYNDNYQYEVVNRTYLTYDERGNKIAETTRSIGAGGVENETGTTNVYVYDDVNKLVADTIVGQWSTVAHSYAYDADGLLSEVQYYNYNSYDSTWTVGTLMKYSYGLFSESHVVKDLTARTTTEEPTTVIFSFTAPEDKEGLQGYQVLTDGVLTDSIYTAEADGSLLLPEQARGAHTYRLLPVYGGVASNVSDELTYTVVVALNAPRNIRFVNKEYVGSSWNITFTWDTPEEGRYPVTGYRWVSGYSNGTLDANTFEANFSDYGFGGDTTVIKVYAIYNVGESDAAELKYAVKDHNDQITAHYHNKIGTVTDENGTVTGLRHYLYVPKYDDWNVGEDAYVTIYEDTDGNPLLRETADGTETKKWDASSWSWKDYRKTETIHDSNYMIIEVSDYEYVDGEWKPLRRDYTRYDNADSPYTETGRQLVIYNDNDSTVYNYTRTDVKTGQWGSLVERIDSLYDLSGNLAGKIDYIVKGYDRSNTLRFNSVTDSLVVDGVMTPVKRVSYDYSDGWDLLSITHETFAGSAWTVDSKESYSYVQSKEYSRTHTPEGDFTQDLDKNDLPIVTWPAPVRTKGLTAYDLYLDDVLFATVVPEDTTYNFSASRLTDAAIGTHSFRVMAMYDGDENCVSEPVEVEINIATAIAASLKADGKAVRTEVYDITGRRLSVRADAASLSQMKGQVLVIKTIAADGSATVRKVIIK